MTNLWGRIQNFGSGLARNIGHGAHAVARGLTSAATTLGGLAGAVTGLVKSGGEIYNLGKTAFQGVSGAVKAGLPAVQGALGSAANLARGAMSAFPAAINSGLAAAEALEPLAAAAL